MNITPSMVSTMRLRFIGKRIRLVHTDDQYTELQSGSEGAVNWVDDFGTIFVDWDSGSKLGLIRGEDKWEILS